jgi:hypothetical protein
LAPLAPPRLNIETVAASPERGVLPQKRGDCGQYRRRVVEWLAYAVESNMVCVGQQAPAELNVLISHDTALQRTERVSLQQQRLAAWNDQDGQRMAAVYYPDAERVSPLGTVRGGEAIRAYAERFWRKCHAPEHHRR